MNTGGRPALSNGAHGLSGANWRQTHNNATNSSNVNPQSHYSAQLSMQQSDNLPTGAPLNDLVNQLEDFHPTIPDAVTSYYVNRYGYKTEKKK